MSLGLNWDCRSVSVGKEFIEWGYGDNGLIVLSQKAPSFPLIRLDINPVDWLNFNYFHPWLFSDVIATVNIYFISTNRPSFSFIEKYLSSHAINLKLYPGLNLALGESIIYSDKFEILYLILITYYFF